MMTEGDCLSLIMKARNKVVALSEFDIILQELINLAVPLMLWSGLM